MQICNENLSIIEPYELIEAGGSFRLHQYRIFQYIIGETFVKDILETGIFYKVSINNYAKFFGLTHKAAYEAVINSIGTGIPDVDMPEVVFTEGAKASKRRRFAIYNAFIYDTETSEVRVRLADELILLYNRLGEEGRGYAKYVLEHTRYMKSINSIRLFRLMNKWRRVGYVQYKLDDFRYKMGFEEDEYATWDNLNRKVIVPSIAEIHREAYLKIEMDVIKEGRKIVGVKFIIKNTNKAGKKA